MSPSQFSSQAASLTIWSRPWKRWDVTACAWFRPIWIKRRTSKCSVKLCYLRCRLSSVTTVVPPKTPVTLKCWCYSQLCLNRWAGVLKIFSSRLCLDSVNQRCRWLVLTRSLILSSVKTSSNWFKTWSSTAQTAASNLSTIVSTPLCWPSSSQCST